MIHSDNNTINNYQTDPKHSFSLSVLINSIGSIVIGLDEVKKAALCYLVSTSYNQSDYSLNVLLIGDPGTGKTKIIEMLSRCLPEAIIVEGDRNITTTIKDIQNKKTNNVLNNYVLIDDIDLVEDVPSHRVLKKILEQPSTSVFVATTPTYGRYNPYATISQNIPIPVTLLNLFDLIFILRDSPEEEKDKNLANHILFPEQCDISRSKLISYLAKARNINPILSDESKNHLRDYYLELRSLNIEAPPTLINVRLLQALTKLTISHAKLYIRETTDKKDAEFAVKLMEKCLKSLGISSESPIHHRINKPRYLNSQIIKLLDIFIALESKSIPVKEEDLIESLKKSENITYYEARGRIEKLVKNGFIHAPKKGYYERVKK